MMFKIISLGALAFAPIAITNQQTVRNQNQNQQYPKIFDHVFEMFFKSTNSPFTIDDGTGLSKINTKAFEDFKKTTIFKNWKSRFVNFLGNLNSHFNNGLAENLSSARRTRGVFYPTLLFNDYANIINYVMNLLPDGPSKFQLEKQRDSMPFIKEALKNKSLRFSFYKDMVKKIIYENSNKIPSNLMRENLRHLEYKIDNFIDRQKDNIKRGKIEFEEFGKIIKDNNYKNLNDLKNIYDRYLQSRGLGNNYNLDNFLSTFKDSEKYKALFEKFEKIFQDKLDAGGIDFQKIVDRLDPNIINSIVKNEEIFKTLGSNAPTMNSVQKGLTIAGGFGTLLISFFTAALALKLILIKSSRRAIALSTTGTITLFGAGTALVILAFI